MNEPWMIIVYVVTANLITFLFMGMDKRRARNGECRIPERTFWGLAVIGGSLGVYFGMRNFRHKTKHRSFVIGIPALIFVQIALVGYLYIN